MFCWRWDGRRLAAIPTDCHQQNRASAMKPHQSALDLVMGVFILVLGAFTVLRAVRSGIDALRDTGSILELAVKTWAEAPFWAVAVIVVGLGNLFSIWVWPWLQQQIDDKSNARTKAIERARVLTMLFESGQDLLAEEVTQEQVPDWIRRTEKWEVVTLKYLATAYSQQDASAFKYVHYNPSTGFPRAANDAHKEKFLQNTVRCETLKAILQKDSEAWEPVNSQQRKVVVRYLTTLEAKLFPPNEDKAP